MSTLLPVDVSKNCWVSVDPDHMLHFVVPDLGLPYFLRLQWISLSGSVGRSFIFELDSCGFDPQMGHTKDFKIPSRENIPI